VALSKHAEIHAISSGLLAFQQNGIFPVCRMPPTLYITFQMTAENLDAFCFSGNIIGKVTTSLTGIGTTQLGADEELKGAPS
jgi:hypothetical protein